MNTSRDDKIFTYANVIFKEDDVCTYCYIADEEIHAGDLAAVVTDEGTKYTLVVYLTHATSKNAPYPFEKLKHIKGRVPKDDPEYTALYCKFLKRRPYVWGDDGVWHEVFADDGDSDIPNDDWPDAP